MMIVRPDMWRWALVVLLLPSMAPGVLAQTGSFGETWIRTHPFQIMALSSDSFSNWDAAEYAAAGMNTTLDWEKSLSMLTASAAQGLPWIYNVQEDPNQVANPGSMTQTLIDEIQNAYNTDPSGNNGWLVYDEVTTLKMPAAKTVMDWIKGQYPSSLVFSNARPYGDTPDSYWGGPSVPAGYGWEDYLADHASNLQPHVFMYDLYPFTDSGGTQNPYRGASAVSAAAKAAGLPYWFFTQSFGNVIGKRVPSESDARMEVFLHLTYGFTGVSYFTYEPVLGGDAIVTSGGATTQLYTDIQNMNPEVFNIGERLKFLTQRNTLFVPGETGGVPNSTPYAATHWANFKRNLDHVLDMGVDVSKPGNDGAGKDLLFGQFKDDAGQPYIMLTNVYHGENLTAAQAELDTFVQFGWQVDKLIRVSRQTGLEEVIPLANNRLEERLPGGTGDLYRFGALRQPIVIQTNFVEDFEASTDPGYTPGALVSTQNGWSVTPGALLPIGNGDPDFTGQFLDGSAVTPGPSDTIYTNPAGLGGGLDSDKIYTLSWDWKLDSNSNNQQLGFLGSGLAANLSRDIVWSPSADLNNVTLRVEHGGVQTFSELAIPSFDDPVRFEIVVDGVDNVVYGSVDGVQSLRFFLSEAEIADIRLIQMRTDNSNSHRRFPQTDNILLTTSIAPVSWGLDGAGDWNVGGNWNTGNDPDGVDASAIFAVAISAPTTVNVNASRTVGALELDNVNPYTLSHATNTLTLQTSAGSASVKVLQGSHELNVGVQVASDTSVNVAAGTALKWSGPVTVAAGKTATFAGTGRSEMTGPLSFGAGSTVQVSSGELNLLLSQAGTGTGDINVGVAGALTGSGNVPAHVTIDGLLAPGIDGVAPPALFFENFEAGTDTGYTPGALLDTQNGWSVDPTAILPIGSSDPDFTGQFLDGPSAANGPDQTVYDNGAGIISPLDVDAVHRLSWDWKLDSNTNNQSVGMLGTSTSLTGDMVWIASATTASVRFRYRPDGGATLETIVPMSNIFADPKNFEIVIDGVVNEVYGVIDGVEMTPRYAISDTQIAALDGLRLFTDNGSNRHFPQTDNILLDATLATGGALPADVAVMNIAGDIVFGSTGLLEIQLNGVLTGEYDALNITGAATLDGTLDVELLDNLTPAAGSTFTILTASSVSGTFTESLPSLTGNLAWFVNYNATSVELVATYGADFDEDGDVDANDLALWEAGFGSSIAIHVDGDANADGVSDGLDFLVWQQQLGSMAAGLSASQRVPEPGTATLVMILAASFAALRRRRG